MFITIYLYIYILIILIIYIYIYIYVCICVCINDLNEPKCPASITSTIYIEKQLKHPKLSLIKLSQNMFRNIYNPIIKTLLIILDYKICLSD